MKLAEALILRADTQKRIEQLKQRLIRSAKIQEGEQPAENILELMTELDNAITQLTTLIKKINQTNALTRFQSEASTLSDALAARDTLLIKRNAYSNLIDAAAIRQERYSRSEVRFISTVDIATVQRQLDNLSRDYRELDSQIQALNWQTDLIEN